VNWQYQVGDGTTNDYGKIVSSAAVATINSQQVVFFGGGATLYMLDATNGSALATECVDPKESGHSSPCTGATTKTVEIEASPSVVDEGTAGVHVIVGMDFNETTQVGRAGVIDFRVDHSGTSWSLTPVWKFDPEALLTYTTDNAQTGTGFVHTADPLSSGGATSGHGCGNVWSSPVVDQVNNVIVFGTGNCDTNPTSDPGNIEPGSGEAVYSIALATGGFRWRYAPRPQSVAYPLDLDFGASAQILPDGKVGEGGKDGYYYAFSETQEATPVPEWTSHVSTQSDIGGMIGSTAIGKVCTPSALLPQPPATCEDAIFATSAIPLGTNSGNIQADFQDILSPAPGHAFALHAISAVDGHNIWDSNPLPSYSAATYTNGVVFVSDTFGFQLQAYNADNGALMWAFPVNGAPSSAITIVGDSIYAGSGTTENGLPLDGIGGIWAFQVIAPPSL
jgi:outer membrane protein assembly factor BamB